MGVVLASLIRRYTVQIGPEILNLIADIDELKGACVRAGAGPKEAPRFIDTLLVTLQNDIDNVDNDSPRQDIGTRNICWLSSST